MISCRTIEEIQKILEEEKVAAHNLPWTVYPSRFVPTEHDDFEGTLLTALSHCPKEIRQ